MARAPLELLSVGEAFEDLIFAGLTRLPELGEELRTPSLVRTLGGGVLITSVAAARLGVRCAVMSGLSEVAARFLRAERIAVKNLRRDGEPHAVSAALSTLKDRSFVTFNGVNDHLESRLLEALARPPAARHLHLALCPKRCSRWLPVLEAARARGVTTSWDFGWNDALLADRGFPALMAAVDVLFVNEREARHYSGAGAGGLREAATFFRAHCRLTVLKIGAAGARWLSREGELTARPPKVRVLDTTGAGDAFNGGFLKGWLRGEKPAECLRLGNLMGALSTRAAGGIDALPRRSELS